MDSNKQRVTVYLINKNERSTEQNVADMVRDYCKMQGISIGGDDELEILRTQKGKPYFSRLEGIYFSVSHSGDYFACAVSDFEVGLDIQEHTRGKGESVEDAKVRFSKLAHRFFSAKEAEYVDGERYLRFFEVWSARESYVKYTGQGIDKYFSEHCTVPEGFIFDESDSVKKWRAMGSYFASSVIDDKYTWCVCGEQEIEVDVRNFNV